MVGLLSRELCSQKFSFMAGKTRRQPPDYQMAQPDLGGSMQVKKTLRGAGGLLNLLTNVT